MSHPKDPELKQAKAKDPAEGEPGVVEPAAVADQAAQIARLQTENKELMETLVRRQADFENYRKRVERDRHHESRRGVTALVEQLLPVLDAFDRAIASHQDPAYEEYRKGFELIRRQVWDVLAKQGVERIEAMGKKFNPHEHHAIERVESLAHEDEAVIQELQTGYRMHDRVLRPAMVRVAVHPAHKMAKSDSGEN